MSSKVSVLLLVFFAACSPVDSFKENKFAGTYWMSISPETNKEELSTAREEMKKEMDQAKEEIKKSMEEAKADLKEQSKDSGVELDGLGKVLDGVGKLAEGAVEMAEAVSETSLNLPESLLNGLKIKLSFKEDGTVKYAEGSKLNINSNIVKWEIRNDKLVLIDEDGSEEEFEMKKVNNNEWELRKENVVLHLTADK